MQNRNEITVELAAILTADVVWPVAIPYRVPAGYFNELSDIILDRVRTNLPGKSNVYTLPDNYFDQLPAHVLQAIRHAEVSDELQEVAPFLSTIPKKDPYHVHELPALDVQTIIQGQQNDSGKIVAMAAPKKHLWMRYAAAAIMTGVLITAAFIYNGSKDVAVSNVGSYAQIDVSNEISKLSEDELNSYLTSAEKLVTVTADRESLLIDELPDVNDHLDYMSDDELNQYLKESTESASTETVDINS